MGYLQAGYFPNPSGTPLLRLHDVWRRCPARWFPEGSFSWEFIPAIEKRVLKKARLQFTTVDPDDLHDILSSHDVQVHVDEDNLESVLTEVSHKELIQELAYVAKCWHEVFRNDLKFVLGPVIDPSVVLGLGTHHRGSHWTCALPWNHDRGAGVNEKDVAQVHQGPLQSQPRCFPEICNRLIFYFLLVFRFALLCSASVPCSKLSNGFCLTGSNLMVGKQIHV